MSAHQPAIQPRDPIVNDAMQALEDTVATLEHLAGTVEANAHNVWDLLDSRCFREGTETDLVRVLRHQIHTLAMRQSVAEESLHHHIRTLHAIRDALEEQGAGGAV